MAKIKGGGGHSESSSSHPGHQISGNAGSSGSFGGSAGATSPVRHNPLTYQHGHSFIKKTFHKPTTNCHFCAELLWGLMGQGYICEGKTIFFFKKATQQISSKNAWKTKMKVNFRKPLSKQNISNIFWSVWIRIIFILVTFTCWQVFHVRKLLSFSFCTSFLAFFFFRSKKSVAHSSWRRRKLSSSFVWTKEGL